MQMPDIAREAAEALFGHHNQENTMTTPAQPTVLADTAAILNDLAANLLISRLYEAGLGKRLQPGEIQTVISFVTGLEAPRLPLPQAVRDDTTTAQPVAP